MKTFLILILTLTLGQAASVTLAWNASVTPNVQYRLKWGFASGSVNQTHVVEAGSELMATVEEPWAPGTTVYFTAYAWNEDGESVPSNEVNWTVPLEPPPTPTPRPKPQPPGQLKKMMEEGVWNWFHRKIFS
jgi:hypothetical protein